MFSGYWSLIKQSTKQLELHSEARAELQTPFSFNFHNNSCSYLIFLETINIHSKHSPNKQP